MGKGENIRCIILQGTGRLGLGRRTSKSSHTDLEEKLEFLRSSSFLFSKRKGGSKKRRGPLTGRGGGGWGSARENRRKIQKEGTEGRLT